MALTGIHRLSLATDDVARYAAIMSDVLGVDGQAVVDEAAGASGVGFEVGGHRLEYPGAEWSGQSFGSAPGSEYDRRLTVSVSIRRVQRRSIGSDETEGVRMSLTTSRLYISPHCIGTGDQKVNFTDHPLRLRMSTETTGDLIGRPYISLRYCGLTRPRTRMHGANYTRSRCSKPLWRSATLLLLTAIYSAFRVPTRTTSRFARVIAV